MPHPDTANRQQAQAHIRVPVVLQAFSLTLLLVLAGLSIPGPAKTAVLKEVRMGNHGDYVRVVFEFTETVQYQVSENAAAGSATIRFLDTTSELPVSPISGAPECIDTLSAFQDGSHVLAKMTFDPKGVKLNSFTLQGPDRMVMDVFCGKETALAETRPEPRETVYEPQNARPDPSQIASNPIRPATEIVLERPPATQSSLDNAQPSIDQTRTQQVLPKKKDSFQKYLLLLLASITVIILVLITLIIFQKSRQSNRHMARNPDAGIDSDDMMHAIDTQIKQKLMKYDE